LIDFDGRTGLHFPQVENGVYAGHHPADGDEAIAHLEQLRAYIERDNPAAAARTADRILDSAERLEQLPYLGRPGRATATRELVVPHTPYVLIYRVHGEALEILRVLHGAQRWPLEPGEQ